MAIRRRVEAGPGNAHRFLFPYIMAAGIAGILPLAALGLELFVSYYSGAVYIVVPTVGTSLWPFLLTMLPAAGIVPVVGGRPVLMMVLGLLGLLPTIIGLW